MRVSVLVFLGVNRTYNNFSIHLMFTYLIKTYSVRLGFVILIGVTETGG